MFKLLPADQQAKAYENIYNFVIVPAHQEVSTILRSLYRH
jgi:hypothetical protein